MTKPAKLYGLLIAGRAGAMSFRDFEMLLRAFGFELDRQKGSYRSYKHPKVRRAMVVQPRGTEAKDYQVAQFVDMVEEYGLTIDDQ